ncbi:MAG: pseudaminic acid cytidylyltransferase [Candidatus Caenarcaniphilales bacterium]|nr:pseudaminic acid cytidylyltransferase [Candidatus Caenarcaniphilales bacterium]
MPKKNIMNFMGKPMISYTINAALKSEIFERVFVSTDDKEIMNIGRSFDAEVPFLRDTKYAGDTVPGSLAIYDFMTKLGHKPDYLCIAYATAPLLNYKNLIKSFHELVETQHKALVSVTYFGYPPQRGMLISDNIISFREKEYINLRSQELEKVYHDAAQFYWIKFDEFMKNPTLIPDNSRAFIIPPHETQDIDNYEDLLLAEIKYKKLYDIK